MTESTAQIKTAYTKKDVEDFLGAINAQLEAGEDSNMHVILSLNDILRQPNARELLDEELLSQARSIWKKVKALGPMLSDPPILFEGSDDGASH